MDGLVAEGGVGREPAQDARDQHEPERLGHRARQRHLLHEADREGAREIHDEGGVRKIRTEPARADDCGRVAQAGAGGAPKTYEEQAHQRRARANGTTAGASSTATVIASRAAEIGRVRKTEGSPWLIASAGRSCCSARGPRIMSTSTRRRRRRPGAWT